MLRAFKVKPEPRCASQKRVKVIQTFSTETTTMSNSRVAPGGMTSPAPLSP
jgi:hypothetical protein